MFSIAKCSMKCWQTYFISIEDNILYILEIKTKKLISKADYNIRSGLYKKFFNLSIFNFNHISIGKQQKWITELACVYSIIYYVN